MYNYSTPTLAKPPERSTSLPDTPNNLYHNPHAHGLKVLYDAAHNTCTYLALFALSQQHYPTLFPFPNNPKAFQQLFPNQIGCPRK